MGFITLKVSEELLTKFGASATDFEEKANAILGERTKLQSEATEFKSLFASLETKVNDLSAKIDAGIVVNEATKKELTAAAEAAGCKAATAVIAKAGTTSVTTSKTETGTESDKALDVEAEDAKAIWDSNKNIRAEFVSFEAFEKWHTASKQGRIKLSK